MNKLKTIMIAATMMASVFTVGSAQAATIACVDADDAVCVFDGVSGGWTNLKIPKKSTVSQSFSLLLDSAGVLDVSITSTYLDLVSISFGGVTLTNLSKGYPYSFDITPMSQPQLLTVTMKNQKTADYGYSSQLVFTGVGGVPEPATWGLMIAGFGMAGGALRRRRTARAAIA